MIVSWNWLKEYVRLDLSVDDLVDRLMMSGLNHESTEEVGGDLAIDLEVTSNRPDCLGQLGIAREVAVLTGQTLKLPPTDFPESDTPTEKLTSVAVEPDAKAWCPQYRARVIEGVRIGPSPDWMQRRLRSVGLNPINNVVDITNYVLMECGQPLHAFDYDKLKEKRIVVRNARPKEPLVAINNKTYELEPWMGVIADATRPVALAGVMGGADTEVGDATTTILLESAEFTPLVIRRASRALDLSSDSSYRFERKIDPAGVIWASDRACHLICSLAGGKVAKGAIHVGTSDYSREPVKLRLARIERILGISIPDAEVTRILESLGMQIASEANGVLTVVPPSHRRDQTREIDLIEEIGRVHGYETIPEDRVIPMAVSPVKREDRVLDKIRDALSGFGYCESVTFSFTDSKTSRTVRPWTDADPLTVVHSSRKQENELRQSTLPSLLQAMRLNEARGASDIELFEVARVYLPKAEGLPKEPTVIGLANSRDIRVARGHLEALFRRLGVAVEFSPTSVYGLAEGKAAEYRLANGGERIGVIGIVSDAAKEVFELRGDAVVAELILGPLVERAQLVARVEPVPLRPSVVRDLAIVLDEAIRWADLESLARQSAGPQLESLEFVDLYRGKQVDAGKKSIAFRLTYRAADRTLTREEVDGYQQQVVDKIAEKLGGKLR